MAVGFGNLSSISKLGTKAWKLLQPHRLLHKPEGVGNLPVVGRGIALTTLIASSVAKLMHCLDIATMKFRASDM